jgi:hypothetical protein
MSDWWNQRTEPEIGSASEKLETPAECPWCTAPTRPGATYCDSCGAVMAQREDLGGILVPGVTGVDPAMSHAGPTSPLVRANSGIASVNLVGAVGGTSAQMAAAAVILAKDHFASGAPQGKREDLGRPSQAALDMARRLEGLDAPAEDSSAAPKAQPEE